MIIFVGSPAIVASQVIKKLIKLLSLL